MEQKIKCADKIRIALSVAMCFAVVGCASTSTTPEQRAEQRKLDEQRRIARHEADEERRADDERRHAEDDLRHKFARYTTGELKLMDTRYKELRQSSGRDLDVTLNPMARKIWGNSDTDNAEKIIEIERELLRRWKAGDTEAHLAEFDDKM